MILGYAGWDPPHQVCSDAIRGVTTLPVKPIENLEPTCTTAKDFRQIGSNEHK